MNSHQNCVFASSADTSKSYRVDMSGSGVVLEYTYFIKIIYK